MKLRKSKKGFTVVELVIVIAVIAVLAAILIPTFISLDSRAKKASDQSLVSNLNTALAAREGEADDTHNDTMHDAVLDLEKWGYKLDALVTKSGEDLLWDSKTNRFLLSKDAPASDVTLWRIQKAYAGETAYSVYASEGFAATVENLKVGFDAGYNTGISSVSYTGDQDVVIRTNGGLLTVNAPSANVTHYGQLDKALIEAVKSESYHEQGQVPSIEIKQGRVEIAQTAEVQSVVVSGNNVKVDAPTNNEVEVKVAEGVTGATVTGVTPTTVKLVTSLSSLTAGDSVVLNADLTGENRIDVANVTLDLNGHSITHSGRPLHIYAVGTKIEGSGLIKSTANVGMDVLNGGELEIKDATVEAQEAAIMAFTGSKLTINSGKYIAHDNFVIGTNGSTGKGGNIITINGGEFNGTIQSSGYIACGVYAANDDVWTINGGVFNIYNGAGVVCRAGQTTIGQNVEINVFNDGSISSGKVGDSTVQINTSAYIVQDFRSGYPGGTPSLVNNSKYSVQVIA